MSNRFAACAVRLPVAVFGLGIAACHPAMAQSPKQVGANPELPPPQEYLMPPVRIARQEPWGDKTPTVPPGLQIHALASDLKNPRALLALPNGDILVVESRGPEAPINRPKDLVVGLVQSLAHTGAPGANQITLLRDIGPDGVAKTRTVFLDHLDSPFGIASSATTSTSPTPTRFCAFPTPATRRTSPRRPPS